MTKLLLDASLIVDMGKRIGEKQKTLLGEPCPFCGKNEIRAQLSPVLKRGAHWQVRKSGRPYPGIKLHLMLIHKEHIEQIADLEPEAITDLFELLRWTEEEFKIKSGTLALRFGDSTANGATVKHLHAQIMVAYTDDESPVETQAEFPIGPKPKPPQA